MAAWIRILMKRSSTYAMLRYGFIGLSLLASVLVHPSAASAETLPICEVSGAVGVPFSPNLAGACANNSSLTACSLVGGAMPLAPGITELAGCMISGMPRTAGVFKGGVIQIGSSAYELEIDIAGSLSGNCTPWNITTFAGSGTITGPASSLAFGGPIGVASDTLGNVYIASNRNQIFKVDGSGNLTTVAGNASAGYTGDGGPAINASFDPNFIGGALGILVADSFGNLYIADEYNGVVRRVDASTAIVTTVAGGGSGGNGGLATSASLHYPNGVAVDKFGNIFIGEGFGGSDVRRVDAKTGIITTVAGILGSGGYSGDGGPATSAQLGTSETLNLAVDGAGNVYIADVANSVLRAVNMQASAITVAGIQIQPGNIATIAGNGISGYSGDGGPATRAKIGDGGGLTVDNAGNVFIADPDYGKIRRVDAITGVITTFASSSTGLKPPVAIAVNGNGDLISATGDGRDNAQVQRIDHSTGTITTLAGGTGVGDGGPATTAELYPYIRPGLATDAAGNLFIADMENNRVRRVGASSGIITTIAGDGSSGYTGDGGPATSAQLSYPSGIAIDSAGNIFIADSGNSAVRRVDVVTDTISTVATGVDLADLAVDGAGNLFIADDIDNDVKRVDATTGAITTVAGDGTEGYSGDGGLATNAELFIPEGVAVDSGGDIFIADDVNGRVRRVDANTGIITTVAGGGSGGNGGPAIGALLIRVWGVAVSPAGNLFIADEAQGTVFRVDHISGLINAVAGNGTFGYSGDGGCATGAALDDPTRVTLNGGHLYIGDAFNNRIRHIPLPAFVNLSPGSLSFSGQNLNTSSSAQTLTLTNSGDLALSITSIAASGDYSETNNCGASLAISASCTITVAFNPTAGGARSGAITVTDGGGDSPQVIPLTGTGVGPGAILSVSNVSFPATLPGSSSSSSPVTLTNNGNATLTISSIAVAGSNANDFTQTNTCGSSLAASASCTINVIFKPSASGDQSASLSITDNASGNPQTVTLTGTGDDFTLTAASGSAITATVAPGSSATYTLSVADEAGLNQSVSLTCAGAPSEATCAVSPDPASTGSSGTKVTVSVSTTAASGSGPRPRRSPPTPPQSPGLRVLYMLALALAVMLWVFLRRNQIGWNQWHSAIPLITAGMLLALALAGCGGGGGGGGGPIPNLGTPAGSYTLTVTGTAGSGSSALSHSVTVTLTVS